MGQRWAARFHLASSDCKSILTPQVRDGVRVPGGEDDSRKPNTYSGRGRPSTSTAAASKHLVLNEFLLSKYPYV